MSKVFYKSRELVAAKQGMGSCYETGSSSLPALMDSYITFDQTQTHVDDQSSQQVPCFSIFNQNPIFPHITASSMHMEPNDVTYKGIPNMGTCLVDDQYSCDKKVLKAVLSQLSSMDSNPNNLKGSSSLGEGSTSESYLSDVGMPNFWNHY